MRKKNDIDTDAVSLAIYEKMVKALDEDELRKLCKQVSEKYLDEDNELYRYFHDKGDGVSIRGDNN